MNRDDIHSCGYYCTRPACVLAQRNELRGKLEQAVLAEREACAEILERNAEVCKDNSMLADVLAGNALAIRARGRE